MAVGMGCRASVSIDNRIFHTFASSLTLCFLPGVSYQKFSRVSIASMLRADFLPADDLLYQKMYCQDSCRLKNYYDI